MRERHEQLMKDNIEEKLDIISQVEKGMVDMCHNVKLTLSSVCTICDSVDRSKKSAKSGTKVFVQADYHIPFGMTCDRNYGWLVG
jgi:hypothetical protein